MNPIAAGLFVGASFLTSIYANRQQAKIEKSSARLQANQEKLRASEAALERTKMFRQSVANNLALSGMGVGSTTALPVANAESFGNYLADIGALNASGAFAESVKQANLSATKSKRLTKTIGAIDSAYTLSKKLGLFV